MHKCFVVFLTKWTFCAESTSPDLGLLRPSKCDPVSIKGRIRLACWMLVGFLRNVLGQHVGSIRTGCDPNAKICHDTKMISQKTIWKKESEMKLLWNGGAKARRTAIRSAGNRIVWFPQDPHMLLYSFIKIWQGRRAKDSRHNYITMNVSWCQLRSKVRR